MNKKLMWGFSGMLIFWASVSPAFATNTVLTGVFDGSEAVAPPLHNSVCDVSVVGFPGSGDLEMAYFKSDFRVSVSGSYSFYDGLWASYYSGAMPVRVLIFQQVFDPAEPALNLLTVQSENSSAISKVNLSAGVDYVLVIQRFCSQREGSWILAFDGPGKILSSQSAEVPSFTAGSFGGTEAKMSNPCISDRKVPTKQFGPRRVSIGGSYFFGVPGWNESLAHLCVSVYSAPPNPTQPLVNRVALLTCCGPTVGLEAGRDYYFVVQQNDPQGPANYSFILAPPASFRINRGISDLWVNPAASGQGFMLDVLEQRNEIELAWLTFAPEPQIDDPAGQLWLTASGPFAGRSANLDLQWNSRTTGSAGDETPGTVANGTLEVSFDNCSAGTINYSWNDSANGLAAATGTIPIQRIATDSVALCESSYKGPGMAGPL